MFFRFYNVASAVFAIFVLLVVLYLLAVDSVKVLSSIPLSKFVTGRWSPSSGEYNLLPMAVGGLAASTGALMLVAPLSVFAAMALQLFTPPSLSFMIRKIFEMMSGIPSVIFGLWGLGVIVPLIGEWTPPGASLLAAILVLSLMVLPSSILLVTQALNEVPKDQMAATLALSLSLASQIRVVIYPFVFTRVVSVMCLQFARTLGETMAVVMVAGNIPSWPTSIFDPIRTLTGHIALEMPYAEGLHRSSLMLSGLLLCLPSLVLFYLARSYLESRRSL